MPHPLLRLRQLLLLPLLLLASSCLHFQQELRLEDDRTGSFRVDASLPVAAAQLWLADTESPVARRFGRYFDPEQGAALFPATAGVRLSAYRIFDRDGRRYLHLEGTITDLPRALASGCLGPWTQRTLADGTRELRWLPPLPGHPPDAAARTAWQEALAGLRLRLQVTAPSRIRAAPTATQTAGNTATWALDAEQALDQLLAPGEVSLTY
jgi:hypothetical protein